MIASCCFIEQDIYSNFNEEQASLLKNGSDIVELLKMLKKHARKKNITVFSYLEANESIEGSQNQKFSSIIKKTQKKEKSIDIPLKNSQIVHKTYLQNYSEIILEKKHFDIFTNAHTLPFLHAGHFQNVVVYGLGLEYGIAATVTKLIEKNYTLWIPVDAVSCIHEKNREKTLIELRKLGANMVNTDFILQNS